MSNRRPAGDGMVRKREDGRWEGRIVVGHKKDDSPIYRYVFGKTQKELMEKLHQNIETYRDAELTEDSRMTLADWLEKWLNEYIRFSIRENTWEGYRQNIKNHINPYLGDKQIAFITTADIQKMYNKLKKQGRVEKHPTYGYELSDSMVRSVHMVLHQALDAAVKELLIVKNPTNGTTIPKINRKEKQIFTENQLDKFMEAIKQDELWYDFFYTEITTGLRRGEICGLKWQDFDEATGRLKICRTLHKKKGGGFDEGNTKTDTGTRIILLPQSTADIRFHDLRHTFVTVALEHGMDVKTLSTIIGHVSAATTLNIYSHITDNMQQQAADNIDRKIGKIEPKPQEREKTQAAAKKPHVSNFKPTSGKIRKPGTGCITMINDHLFEGRFTPTNADGKRISKNVYALTRDECEEKLAELIVQMKAKIAAEKEKLKAAI